MTALTRRHVVAGAAAAVACAAVPTTAQADDLPRWVMTAITWNASPPRTKAAVGWEWEGRLRKLLWLHDEEGWICIGKLTRPTPVALDREDHGPGHTGPRCETFVMRPA
jgi:hypothetical protein